VRQAVPMPTLQTGQDAVMENAPRENTSSASTTWAWRQVKIKPHASATHDSAKRLSRASFVNRIDLRKPVKVTVRFRGGPECWWELQARGRTYRRPGSLALHDVLREIYGASTRVEDGDA
jgi:hypothetical protein